MKMSGSLSLSDFIQTFSEPSASNSGLTFSRKRKRNSSGNGRVDKKMLTDSDENFKVTSSASTDVINISADDEVILAVYWKRGKLGAAYYTVSDAEVHILNDVVDIHPGFKNLRCLLNQVQYTLVITCSALADSFTKTLTQLLGEDKDDRRGSSNLSSSMERSNNDKLHLISGQTKNFNYDACKRLILGHRLFCEPKFSTEEEHLLFMNTYIDFKKESMVMSLGILFKFLEKYIPQKNLSREPFRISIVQHINLENVVSMDEATYEALQIFRTVHHPSAFKRSNQTSNREGLSVFGIFNGCKSKIGHKKMRHLFTSPIKDMEELNARLDAVEFCCNPTHDYIVKNLSECIKKGILSTIYKSRSNINHWQSLYSSLYNAILIGQICETHSSQSKLFLKISRSVTTRVHEAAHFINHVIDFEESVLTDRFTVRVGIDSKLDKMRQAYAHVPGVMVKVAKLELRDLPEYIGQCSVVYITELGYLLSVPVWQGDGTNAMDYQLPNFEVKFVVNNYVHYKTPRCAELDNTLGDVLASMCRLESKIMVALMEFVHERVSDIVCTVDFIAELDCVIAMAKVASEKGYVRPVLTAERKLEILKGRHPLQELCVKNFVPNNASFSVENGTIKILTGPNASGKSVYLKQISLIVFLAHIGSFVPAEKALICILDHIHTRIHTLESISTRMSSFILDLKQMSHALYNSTPSTLIIVDEFGKGTTEIDGLSLLSATLIHLVERKENCPFVLVSTHFHTLPKLLPDSPLISLQYMDYVIENEEIVYLHRIKNGTCGSSLSCLAAKSAGFRENSLKRFMQIISIESKPLMCYSRLKVTRTMVRGVRRMERLLDKNNLEGNEMICLDRERN